MRQIAVTVLNYEELSEKAQDKAREWYKESHPSYDWSEWTRKEFETDLATIGFGSPSSQFSGFYSQGDGASFDFKSVDFEKLFNAPLDNVGTQFATTVNLWRATAATLIRKASRVTDRLSAHSSTTDNANLYCHENTRYASLELDNASNGYNTPRLDKVANELETALTVLMRHLAVDFYRALENEYDHLMSDEVVTESIIDNEFEFTEDGRIFAG